VRLAFVRMEHISVGLVTGKRDDFTPPAEWIGNLASWRTIRWPPSGEDSVTQISGEHTLDLLGKDREVTVAASKVASGSARRT
jgi:hypothetical protein